MNSPFAYCASLTSIEVKQGSESFYSIDGVLFDKSNTLLQYPLGNETKDYAIPSGTVKIGDYAFAGSYTLTSITIPKSVLFLESSSFTEVFSLSSFAVEDGSSTYVSTDGVLFSTPSSILVLFPPAKNVTNYVIPEGTKQVGNVAFSYVKYLENVTIPESVEKLNPYSFSRSDSLKYVNNNAHIREIASFTFSYCKNIVHISIPDSVEYIDTVAFLNCSSLKKIHIPDGVKEIGSYVFAYCDSLTDVNLPSSLNKLADYVFLSTGIESITIPPGVTSISNSFSGCGELKSVFYQGSANLVDSAFSNCNKLDTVCVSPDYPASKLGGVDVTSDKEVCKTFSKLFNRCYAPSFVDGDFEQRMLYNAEVWVKQLSDCGEYGCDNKTGLFGWSLCNSTDNSSLLCMDNTCLDDWSKKMQEWSVVLLYDDNMTFDRMVFSELQSEILDVTKLNTINMTIGLETDEAGNVIHNVLHVNDESTARSVKTAIDDLMKQYTCKYDILCHVKSVTIIGGYSESSSLPPSSSHHSSTGASSRATVMNWLLLLFAIAEMAILVM